MKDTYQTAVLEMIKAEHQPAEVLKGLKNTLEARGHERLYTAVLRGVLRVLEASSHATGTQVVVRSEADYKAHKKAIETALKDLGATEDPSLTVDDTLVGGFIAEHGNVRVDHSYKSKLVSLYRSLTK